MAGREEELLGELRRGLLHQEERHAAARADLLQLAETVYSLVELLLSKGLLTAAELQGALEGGRSRVAASPAARRLPVWNEDPRDKYAATAGAPVDCERRLPLCRAVCCTLQAPLSRQDLEEGVARWDVSRPFYLKRDEDRRCCHQDRQSGGCTIYGRRPLICRSYSCAGDRRIWRDFLGRVPNRKGIDALFAQAAERPLALTPEGGLPALPRGPDGDGGDGECAPGAGDDELL